MAKMNQLFRSLPIRLSDVDRDRGVDGVPKRIQILRCGAFFHPDYETPIEITTEFLESMVQNFSSDVRGVDLAIDYSHDSEDIAAGWIKKLFVDSTGQELWADVEWTPSAQKRLADKEFRYLSADFSFNYQDNETLQTFGPTLFGAGLTNRPFVKNMAPALELTEGKGSKMTKNVKLGGAPGAAAPGGGAAPGDDGKKIAALPPKKKLAPPVQADEMEEPGDGGDAGEADDSTDEADLHTQVAQLKALIANLQKQIGVQMSENAKLRADKAKIAEAKAQTEKKSQFDVMMSEGKVVEAQREAFMEGDMPTFISLAGKVNLSEAGNGTEPEIELPASNQQDAQVKMMKIAKQKFAEKKCPTLDAAIRETFVENPKLKELIYPKRKQA